MEHLTISHIQHYLAYGLKVEIGEYIVREVLGYRLDAKGEVKLFCNDSTDRGMKGYYYLQYCKPLLLPMSSLYTEMEDGTVPMIEIAKIILRPYLQDIDTFKVTTLPDDDSDYKVQVFRDSEDSIIEAIVERNLVEGFVVMTTESQDIIPACNLLEAFTYLFSHHYDVFSLIDNGLAIDKTKIK